MEGQYKQVDQKKSVKKIYEDLLSKGRSPKEAAKEAQARTGVSLVSGRPIVKTVGLTSRGNIIYGGQYTAPKRGSR